MRLLAVLIAVGAGLGWGLAAAPPAHAHAGGGAEPSNYRVLVRSLHPPVPAVQVQVGTGGQWVRVTNRGSGTVIVRGYAGEPFLRLSDGRIRVNRHSTTLADNPELAVASADVDPGAPAEWVRVGEGTAITWSDARVRPDTAAAGADAVRQWRLPLRVDGDPVTVAGTITRVPPPSPWPWVAVTGCVALATAISGWSRSWHRAAAGASALAGAVNAAHLAGVALVPEPGSAVAALAASLGTGLLCWPLAGLAVVAAVRRSEHAAFVAATAGAVVVVLSLGDLAVFWHSQLVFAWPDIVQRALVAMALGLGAGLAVAGVRLLLHAPTPDRTYEIPHETVTGAGASR